MVGQGSPSIAHAAALPIANAPRLAWCRKRRSAWHLVIAAVAVLSLQAVRAPPNRPCNCELNGAPGGSENCRRRTAVAR